MEDSVGELICKNKYNSFPKNRNIIKKKNQKAITHEDYIIDDNE
jgi:hypothetical protein